MSTLTEIVRIVPLYDSCEEQGRARSDAALQPRRHILQLLLRSLIKGSDRFWCDKNVIGLGSKWGKANQL